MAEVSLIFPHQLLVKPTWLKQSVPVYLVEEYLYFKQYKFTLHKLAFHRASMQYYQQHLQQQGFTVQYIPATDALSDVKELLPHLAKQGISAIHYIDVVDNWLQKHLHLSATVCNIKLYQNPTPYFINTLEDVADFFKNRKTYFQTDFYKHERKKRNILIDAHNNPIGGQWTFDADNRSKYPKGKLAPKVEWPLTNNYYSEAIKYVTQNFAKNIAADKLIQKYPCTHAEAEEWLNTFLQQRLKEFGIYEDAIVDKELVLHHSVLTPMLNVGLLQPTQVLSIVIEYSKQYNIPLNSLEGFVRQILGWREFIRIVYEHKGSQQRTTNYWGFTQAMPQAFYNATTGVAPVDDVINKLLNTGYNHHIERLMVLGNFMLLCEVNPDAVYQWFMELYIDAYDWVMVPNVYGMTQFADGGVMTTKPYISGSNYIVKMSNYSKNNEWAPIWDGLFWRFIIKQEKFFSSNPRLGMLLASWHKMDAAKQQLHLDNANNFLNKIHNTTIYGKAN
jgi:deoxyribodipyrimidine photolyase-related protein